VTSAPYLDTSALAKWYLHEEFSESFEEFLQTLPHAHISSLTRIEFRCLLARRRRSQEISAQLESEIQGQFQQDIRQGYLRVLPLGDAHVDAAVELMNRLSQHPLRSLDALHLAIVQGAALESIATADRILAAAAEDLGLAVERFV
jgi:predicted nucleic acid-binding protein